MDYILETRKICHRYSRKTDSYALKDVSIGIRKGVRTAILGANGAGKSTLFYHLNGILKPESGEVFYRGKTLSYKKDHLYQLREDISVVVQNPDEQIFSSTVEEDVAFGPMNLNLHPDIVEQRIRDSLFKVGMEEYRKRPTTQLSFGQRKRVAIAGALAMEPKVLILDEPTAGLDPQMSNEIMELIDQLCLGGTTVVISTHDVDLAYSWADDIHVMRLGRLIYSGEPEGFFEDRDNVVLAGLTLPHTFSVNRPLAAMDGTDGKPYPRTGTQLLARLSNPDSIPGRIRIIPLEEETEPEYGDGDFVAICGFRTRMLFKSRSLRADLYFDAVEGSCLHALNGKDVIIFCDPDLTGSIEEKIGRLAAFGRCPEVMHRWKESIPSTSRSYTRETRSRLWTM